MVLQIVYIKVKPEAVEAFVAATLENTRNSRLESGIAQFALTRQEDDPTRFVLIEAFRSEAAIAAHREAPHYLVWRDAMKDMMAETRSSIRVNSLDPSDKDW